MKIIKNFIIYIYAFLINAWLLLINSFSKYKYIYPEYVSFRFLHVLFISILEIKKKRKQKIILFGGTDSKIIKLILTKINI